MVGMTGQRIQKPDSTDFARARRVVERLREAGHEALLAGGCVRDLLLGRAPKDYDVATSARPNDVAGLFDRVLMVGRQFGVCLVLLDGGACEVATFRRDAEYSDGRHPDGVEFCDVEEDARRRDFTINALYWDAAGGEVLDFVGGCDDLERGVLRAVGVAQERFTEDHLRLLRAVRFASRLRLRVEEETRRALCQMAPLCVQVSAERLGQEMRFILTDERPAVGLRLLDDFGMLAHVLPEVAATKGCEQPPNYHPEGDVFVHSLLAVEKLGPRPEFTLALATLLHDIGKPRSTEERSERAWFPNHDRYGAELAEDVCRRLCTTREERERICWLIARHHYFMNARGMRLSTLKRLFAEPGFDQLAAVHRADALASCGIGADYEYIMTSRSEIKPETVAPEPLLTGRDLIALGMAPGPEIGRVLGLVRDAQLDGLISDHDGAVAFARDCMEADA
jgi:poly(A) polymerase